MKISYLLFSLCDKAVVVEAAVPTESPMKPETSWAIIEGSYIHESMSIKACIRIRMS